VFGVRRGPPYDHRVHFSLLSGWLPWTLRILAIAALAAAVGLRGRYWYQYRLSWAAGAAAALTALCALLAGGFGDFDDPLPAGMWFWLFCALLAVAVLVVGFRGADWWSLAAAPLALLLALVCGANSLNISTGYYPDVEAAVADLSGAPVAQQMSLEQALTTVGRPTGGRIVPVDIPAQPSGFAHRQELVYLPPAWFRSKKRPKLPMVEMIGGQYAAPSNWVRAGGLLETADAYAAAHDGFAPILVMVDPTGGFKTDTECVNGTAGKAEDHLVKDVPPFIAKTFGAAADPASRAVVGWSMGGTCAVTLGVTHPEVFGHFVDISGDLSPNLGSKQQTVDKLYGGDAAAWAAHDPLTVLAAKKGKYKGSSGRFMVGDEEDKHKEQAETLLKAAKEAGLDVRMTVGHGRHDWQFGAVAFREALPWLAGELDTPTRVVAE